MKKSNLITLAVFAVMIVAVMIFSRFLKTDESVEEELSDIGQDDSTYTTPNTDIPEKSEDSNVTAPSDTDIPQTPEYDEKELTPANMTDALFIGDSRTVGIYEYANITEADFFAHTGMSVFNIYDDRISVEGVGKVYLTELLSSKKYGKIYVMLGINELGYDFQSIVNKYKQLVDFICEKQPEAIIFIQANLHLSKARSDSDKVINNKKINMLNAEIAKFADNEKIFYIDANYLFDDENGCLSSDKTFDNAHLYGKYYLEWGEWIRKETAKYIKEK